MKSATTAKFRRLFEDLPEDVKELAKEAYRKWQQDPHTAAVRFKRVQGTDSIYSARIGLHWRALAVVDGDEAIWFWIGSHADYDQLLRRL